jgi:hypothetical protein
MMRRLQTGLGLNCWGGVDASLNGTFDLGAAVAVARARYKLVTWGQVVDGSLAQSTGEGRGRGSRRGLHESKAQGQEGKR